MTTRPRLSTEGNWAAGFAAAALFVVLAVVFLTAGLPAPAGFPDGSVVESIGLAMFNLESPIPSEGFVVAFILIAVLLDAALDGSLMLATRDDDEAAPDGGTTPGEPRDGDRGDT